SAGNPTTSTHYDLTIRFNLAGEDAGGDNNLLETRTTKAGTGYTARKPAHEKGETKAKRSISATNAWVHPYQLEAVLRYARDAFLAGARDPVSKLLAPYEKALGLPLPIGKDAGLPWTEGEAARWTSAQSEIAGMLHRLRNQLDYFGNPAGYMPFLSLQATLRLYDLETGDAIRTLLLAAWVQDVANKEQSAANAFGSAIEELNKDSARIADQLVQSEAKMESLDQQMTSVEQRLKGLGNDLGKLRTELFNEAAHNEQQKALIKAGVKMAAAICQVIPVGQPVLGTIGDLVNIAADIDVEGTPDTVTKMGGTIKKARDAANKAKKAKEEAKKKDKPAGDKETAKKKAGAWEIAGNGFGPALSIAGEAIGALQVSDEQIEVELAKLTAASPKWKALTDQIRTLNKDKAKLFTQLSAVLQAMGDGYAELAGNAASLVTMYEERGESLAKLSVEANQVIAKMGQTARLSLQRSLYLLVKSYETTVFKPIDVDWNLDLVFDKIRELLKPRTGFDAAAINAFAKTISPLFEENRKKIKESLKLDYDFANMKSSQLEFGFTTDDTEVLENLRGGRRLELDPLVLGLILPAQERAKALGFECKKLVFDADGPALASGNAIISLRTSGDGTIRRGEHLYAVRSDAPRVWSWTYHFSDKSLQASVPSLSALDLLNMLLESDRDDIKQKLAAPPAWSELTIDVEFSPPIALEKRPKLKTLVFACEVEAAPAPGSQKVLDVRGASASERISIDPKDLGGRSFGFGNAYRIYSNAATVRLVAPAVLGDRPFLRWEVVSNTEPSRKAEKAEIDLKLDSDTLAYCRYQGDHEIAFTLLEHFGGKDLAQLEQMTGSEEKALQIRELLANTELTKHTPPSAAQPIHAGASLDQPVIGLLPEGTIPTVLEEGGGWKKVAFQGVVGYVR
ncbi:MAG TPA: SH3 domain-containing protein, partial [Candidatus Limnocylindria bacterium]|nr:SH3 domain-containing protein [Candidatus Limnocylindria bacterium]